MTNRGRQLRNDPDARMQLVVGLAGVAEWPESELAQLDPSKLTSWIDDLRHAESSVRNLRNRLEAMVFRTDRRCTECGGPIAGRSDRVLCGTTCRQRKSRRDRRTGSSA